MWGTPLLGAARGDDPIFEDFRDRVDARHWTPAEAFSAAGGYGNVPGGELSVVSWILPHTDITKRDTAREREWPSERWARSRIFGEDENDRLRDHMVEFLKAFGIDAVSPIRLKGWEQIPSERYFLASNWSERHVAYACGLGTFGLCDGLITPLGKAVRIGSIVLRARLSPTSRPYTRHDEYCPFKTSGRCGACIKRCPAGALSERGHDKALCRAYLRGKTAPYVQENYKFKGYGCGLCQTGVPCTSKIPGRLASELH
jgi:epoxyqueuosine reductase QueG